MGIDAQTVHGSMAFGRWKPNVIVVVHSARSVENADWKAFIQEVEAAFSSSQSGRILVQTDGGSPSAMQRAELYVLAEHVKFHVAVMTNSLIARAVVTAFGWANYFPIKSFGAQDCTAALKFLDLPNEDEDSLRDAMKKARGLLT